LNHDPRDEHIPYTNIKDILDQALGFSSDEEAAVLVWVRDN
jgi:hypothetical protein